MSEFSDLLDEYIVRSRLTISYISSVAGISHSYISKIKNGQRICKEPEVMKKIFDELNLTDFEYEELWRGYITERMGKEMCDLNQSCIHFLENFETVLSIKPNAAKIDFSQDVSTLETYEDVNYYINTLIKFEAGKENGKIKLIMQEGTSPVRETLKEVLRSTGISIDQIICLDINEKRNDKKHINIQLLAELIPLILSADYKSYKIYAYYDDTESRIGKFNIMSNYIITEDQIVIADNDFANAIIIKDKDIIKLFINKFDMLKEQIKPIISEYEYDGSNQYNIYNIGIELMRYDMTKPTYSICGMPCVTFAGTEKSIYNALTASGDEKLINMLRNMCISLEKQMENNPWVHISYFTKSGVIDFLENGIIQELHPDANLIVKKEYRYYVVKKILDSTLHGKHKLYLIDERGFKLPRGLYIAIYDSHRVLIYYKLDTIKKSFILSEKLFARDLYKFAENLKESPYVLGPEKAIEFLNSLEGKYPYKELPDD